ncbi:hypothetical protein [Granulicella sp. L60]|uniref:hypothetical protein n=1 Tax=Granulicella sp. L60 TaxID=1641866 RepID=UPI00131E9249|nr:hypothetical protein [Granulicella sp. L60]
MCSIIPSALARKKLIKMEIGPSESFYKHSGNQFSSRAATFLRAFRWARMRV